MSAKLKFSRREKIKKGIRKQIVGTNERPRLSVYRSNKSIYVQIVNDELGVTICAASTRSKDFKVEGKKVDQARAVGTVIAQKALQSGVTKVVFDRNGYLYHGRVKSLAEGAREAGLNF